MLERLLNDYESMLATSTCNIAVRCSIPVDVDMAAKIRQAWQATIQQRGMLRVKLEVQMDNMGVLGPRCKAPGGCFLCK